MNVAVRLLTALALVTLVGCGGDEDAKASDSPKAAESPKATESPLTERVLTAEDVPGSKADPVEKRQTPEDLDDFKLVWADFSIAPDANEVDDVFEKAGYKGAVLDTRYIGATHSGAAPHVAGLVVHVESEDGATSALDFFEKDINQPCPHSCAVKKSDFQVDGIPGARGVHSSASAKDIERIGTPEERPFEGYWVGFTDGPYATTVDLSGPPGSVSEEQALEIATAYYERVVGN